MELLNAPDGILALRRGTGTVCVFNLLKTESFWPEGGGEVLLSDGWWPEAEGARIDPNGFAMGSIGTFTATAHDSAQQTLVVIASTGRIRTETVQGSSGT